MKICQVDAELFHVDGRTDVTKLTVALRNYKIAPKNRRIIDRSAAKYQYFSFLFFFM